MMDSPMIVDTEQRNSESSHASETENSKHAKPRSAEIYTAFKEGRWKNCNALLEMCHSSELDLENIWIDANNSCIKLLTGSKENVEKSLRILHGLPPTSELVDTELILLSNMAYKLLTSENTLRAEKHNLFHCASVTLRRYIGLETCSSFSQNNAQLTTLITDILLSEKVLKISFMLFCIHLTLFYLKLDESRTSVLILDAVIENAHKFKNKNNNLILKNNISIIDSFKLLYGVICGENNSEKAIKLLESIECPNLKIFVYFWTGFVYHVTGQNDLALDALSNCKGESEIEATVRNLIGNIFSLQNKHLLAIQSYKHAFELGPQFRIPLFNASLQYRALNDFEREEKCLKLLLSSYNILESDNESKKKFCCALIQNCYDVRGTDLSEVEIRYLTAKMYVKQKLWNDAGKMYTSVLNNFTISSIVPNVCTVYIETIYSLIQGNDFVEALYFCDNFLSKQKASQANETTLMDITIYGNDSMILTCQSQSYSPKNTNCRMNSNCNCQKLDYLKIILTYKGHTLRKLGRFEDAEECFKKI